MSEVHRRTGFRDRVALGATWAITSPDARWTSGSRRSPTRTADPPLPDQASEEGARRTRAAAAAGQACAPRVASPVVRRRDGHADAASNVRPGGEAATRRQRRAGSGSARSRRSSRELPDYRNGPYADLRKWLLSEIEDTRVRSNAVHRDSIAVRREGAAQIALVGPPNVGKSSLLQALSEIQIKTGDYPFTTLRPVPALTRIGGVLVQLVEIPGLIGGRDRRPGRRPGAARRPALGRRDRLLRPGRRRSRRARGRPGRGRGGRDREAGRPRRDTRRRGRCRGAVDGSARLPGPARRAGLGPRRGVARRVPGRGLGR